MGSLAALSACLAHTLGVLILSLIPTSHLLVAPALAVAAVYYAGRQKIWTPSEKAQPWRQVNTTQSLKIVLLASAKVANFCFLVYFCQKGQVFMCVIDRLLAMETSFLPLKSLFGCVTNQASYQPVKSIGLLLWFLQITLGIYKVGPWLTVLAMVWGLTKHAQDQLNNSLGSIDSSRIRSVTWILALVLGAVLSIAKIPSGGVEIAGAVSSPVYSTAGLYVIAVLLMVVLPEQVAISSESETLRVVSGLGGLALAFLVHRFDLGFYTILSILNFGMTAVLTYESEEPELPMSSKTQSIVQHILSHRDSRNLAGFFWCRLCSLTVFFMFVEAIYGYWSNSLGLMSDAAHMCFDSTALAIGLYASYISKFPPDEEYSYGCCLSRYHRYEVLSGLINGIFLVFVGFSVFVESIERIMEPPTINSEQLILVSVLGLLINVLGLCFFHEHSHEGEDNDSNMHGVFLHILADALGSVGVIVSSIFVHTMNLYIADPICSLIISVLIFLSVGPLLMDSVKVLMQRDVGGKTKKWRKQLETVPGVENVEKMHAWKLAGDQYVLTTVLTAQTGVDLLKLTSELKHTLLTDRFRDLIVQVYQPAGK